MRCGISLTKIFVVAGIVISLLSCNRGQADNESIFEKEIEYIPVSTDQQFLFDNIFNPRKMRVIDGLMLVSDYQNFPPFHVLEADSDGTLNYLRGEGTEGRGPGEFQLVEDFIDTDSLVYVYDGGQLKLISYYKDMNPAPYNDIQMRINGRPITMNAFPNDRFVASGLFFNDRFQVYNTAGEIILNGGEQIAFHEDFTPQQLGTSWYSFSVTHPEKDLVYIFSLNADLIEKYNGEGDLLKRIQGKNFGLPKRTLGVVNGQQHAVDDGSKVAYLWIDTDENYIYALYSGELREDLDGLSANKVHQFDWDLNLIKAYELDHDPYMFAVNGYGGIYSFISVEEGTEFRYLELK